MHNTIVLATLLYHLSYFKMHVWVRKKIDIIRKKFLFEKAILSSCGMGSGYEKKQNGKVAVRIRSTV